MGICIYCGKPAGFLRSRHPECQAASDAEIQKASVLRDEGERQIGTLIRGCLQEYIPPDLKEAVDHIARSHSISEHGQRELVIRAWTTAVQMALHDGVVSDDLEHRLVDVATKFSLSQADLDRSEAYSSLSKAAVLRDVLNGIVPTRFQVDSPLPINLLKSEQLVWGFPKVDYLEDRTRREYIGASRGVSVRVMKGVYYRVGAFKGHSIDRTERIHVDTGWCFVTNKNLCFAGFTKSVPNTIC